MGFAELIIQNAHAVDARADAAWRPVRALGGHGARAGSGGREFQKLIITLIQIKLKLIRHYNMFM